MEPEEKYLFLGCLFGIILLLLNNMISFNIYLFSILSPQGMRFYMFGVRIKHWFIGLILIVVGLFFRDEDPRSYFLIGLGLVLFVDELPEFL